MQFYDVLTFCHYALLQKYWFKTEKLRLELVSVDILTFFVFLYK